MLSILRLLVGLLFLQHGLNKVLDFPPTATHRAYALFTLVPGLAGLLETAGGILIVLGLFTRPAAFIMAGEMAVAYFLAHAPRGSTASSSSICPSPAAAPGASTRCAGGGRRHASPPAGGAAPRIDAPAGGVDISRALTSWGSPT